jgi:hypothetical protein
MAILFTYSLAIGYHLSIEEEPRNRKPYIPTGAFSDTEKWLILSAAIKKTSSLEILLNLNKAIRIAEAYANAGIRKLDERLTGEILDGDPLMRLESDLREAFSKIKLEPTITSRSMQASYSESPMELISKLEIALRDLIWNVLFNGSGDNIGKRLPSNMSKEMIEKWKDRTQKASRSRELFPRANVRLIDYAELGELYQIIIQSELWKNYFEKVFKNKVVFDGDMYQMLMIRPDEAHSRGTTPIQLEKLKGIVTHHILLIDSFNAASK